MKNQKLSIAEFKAMANSVHEQDILETIQGGSLSDCHGWTGSLGKALRSWGETMPHQ